MRNFLLAAVLLGALVTGAWAYVRRPASQADVTPPVAERPVPETPTAEAPREVEPHPVSLEALSRTAFDGRGLKLVRVLAENEAYVRHEISYLSGPLKISGILNVPKGEGPFPLLVLNHGYIDPKIYTNGRGLKREQDFLARSGYAVLHTDYRGHASSDPDPEADVRLRLGYVEDSINAVLAVREAKLPRVDAERVGMLGHSMGGGVTLNAITAVPDLVDAAVLFAPVSGDARDNFEKWMRSRPETAQRILAAYGEPAEAPDFWDGVSAIARLDRVRAPVLLHHGTADESCPVAWSERLAAAFKEAGKPMTYHAYPGEPHEFAAAWPLVMRRTVEFYDAHLKGKDGG